MPLTVSRIAENCTCPICMDVLQIPVTICGEGHTVCQLCLAKWTKTPSPTGVCCPTCRAPINNNGLGIRNRSLENVINTEVIPCCNKPCKWHGERGAVAEHRKTCDNEIITYPCSGIGCLASHGARGKLDLHAKTNFNAHDLLVQVALCATTKSIKEDVARLEQLVMRGQEQTTELGEAVTANSVELHGLEALAEIKDQTTAQCFQLMDSRMAGMTDAVLRRLDMTSACLPCDGGNNRQSYGPVRRGRERVLSEFSPYARRSRSVADPLQRSGNRPPSPSLLDEFFDASARSVSEELKRSRDRPPTPFRDASVEIRSPPYSPQSPPYMHIDDP